MIVGLLTRVIEVVYSRQRSGALEFQPAIVAFAIFACGMALIGAWVGSRMAEGILQRRASETVLNMDSFIKPLVQDLAHEPTLPPAAQEALSAVLMGKTLGRDVAAIKIWSPNGTIAYCNRQGMTGLTYPIFDNLRQALSGQVVAEFDDLDGDENEYERSLGAALLEIYAPIRESGTNRIIAVAEFYEIHDNLQAELWTVRLHAWTMFGLLTIAIIASLSYIMIKQKRQMLERRVAELQRLLSENEILQFRIRDAHHRMAEINELFLRQVSAELHDAPAQLIGFALLRLDALGSSQDPIYLSNCSPPRSQPPAKRNELETIRAALSEALKEIRSISAGLAPPELSDLSVTQALEMAASSHARRTGTVVDCDIASVPDGLDPALKVCLYRFMQEGLNNAFRHASGRGQVIRAHCEDGVLEVTIYNDQAASDDATSSSSSGLGLRGLRGRIEALGGVFEFQSQPGQRTRLMARFNLARMELLHA
jgi:signal transduction histidine kinase